MQVSIEVEEFGNKLENGPEVDPTRVAQKSAIQSLLRVSRSVKSETNEEAADTPIVKAVSKDKREGHCRAREAVNKGRFEETLDEMNHQEITDRKLKR